MDKKSQIEVLKEKVLGGEHIEYDEAHFLIDLEDEGDIRVLTKAACEIAQHFGGGSFDLCSLINAKSGVCAEDCSFCAQSVHYDTGVATYDMVDREAALKRAQSMKAYGAGSYCLVSSGDQLSDDDFEEIVRILSYIKERVDIDLDCSIGSLDRARAERLKAAGVRRINHNLQSSREFYPKIVTSHTYDDRLNALKVLKEVGLEICCGGIIGMGEAREDRLKLAFELAKIEPHVVPINFLDPRPGTPLEDQPRLEVKEIIKTVAVFRFILPHVILALAGGREFNLGEYQGEALQAGSNGLIIGGYLTTAGDAVGKDRKMVREAGFDLAPSEIELRQKEATV